MSGFSDAHILKHISESCADLRHIAGDIRQPMIKLLLDEIVRRADAALNDEQRTTTANR